MTQPTSDPNQPYDPNQAQNTPPEDASVDETLNWVGNDSSRARQALDQESQSSTPRKTLVDKLKSLIS